jgi:co-chaperonin GroES (HSP10)
MTETTEFIDRRKLDADGEVKNRIFELATPDLSYDAPVPMSNYVLIKQNAAETTYEGTRFFIPSSAQRAVDWGVVIAIGPDLQAATPQPVKPGDLVKFRVYSAEDIAFNGEKFFLLSVHDIKLKQSGTYVISH